MGLFNFKKKQSTTTTTTTTPPITHRPTVTVTPSVVEIPVAQQPNEKSEEKVDIQETKVAHQSTPHDIKREKTKEKQDEQKEDVSDFFSVDIYNIFKYEPEPAGNGKGLYGTPVEVFTVPLPKRELSIFNSLQILRYQNGHYDLVFGSDANSVNDELKAFVDFCDTVFGIDFMKKGSINDNDKRDIPLGAFSRIWYGNIRLENPTFTMALTLYDITPK